MSRAERPMDDYLDDLLERQARRAEPLGDEPGPDTAPAPFDDGMTL